MKVIHPLLFGVMLLACAGVCGAADAFDDAVSALESIESTVRRFVLDNGMVCLVREDHAAPVVAIQIWVDTGSVHEGRYLGAGITHAIEHMIFKGTGKRAPGDITREIHDAGGKLNAYTSLDRTVFHTDLPRSGWRTGLDVLADAVKNAAFPSDEWDKERDVILREISMGKDDPGRVLSKLLWARAFRVHPYRFPVIGYREVFQEIERDDLAEHFRQRYVPDNMITVIVGDVDADEAEAELRRLFADFQRRSTPPVVLPEEPPALSFRTDRSTGSYQVSRMSWAFHGVPLSHPDAPALDVLAAMVGQGKSSRLVKRIREELGLVHAISAWSYTPREAGLAGISATFDPDKEDAVVAAVREEMLSWHRARFSQREIDRAVRRILSSELASLRTMHGQASAFASGQFYAGDPAFATVYLEGLQTITPAGVREVARRYFRPERSTLVFVSPEKEQVATGPAAPNAAEPPRAERFVLPNGVRVLLREDRRLPFVYFCAALGGGLLSETEHDNGATRLMAELLVRGTSSRSGAEIAGSVESRGGSLSAFSGRNSFGLKASCLAPDAKTFLDVLTDCLLRPQFDSGQIEKQRHIQLAAIDAQSERPMFVAQQQLKQSIFAGHPYRWDPLGTRPIVEKLDRDTLQAHWKRHVVAGNMVVAIFGDISAADAWRMAEKAFARTPPGKLERKPRDAAASELPTKAKRREPREQAIVLVGVPGVSVLDPRADALSVLSTALSGLSSDLAVSVREERGLAYYVGAYNSVGPDPGAFVFYAGTREDAVPEVQSLIVGEAQRISRDGLRDEELARSKRKLIAGHDMSLQDSMGLAMTCALNELYGLGHDHVFEARQRYEAVTGDNIKAVAQSLFPTNRMAVSIVLPKGEESNDRTEQQ